MLFPTTLVGSYPQPEWLIDRARLAGRFPPRVRARELWRIPEPYLAEAQDDATVLAIRAQEEAGLDIITDGEIRRESYSNRFATALEGVDIDNPGTALDRSGHPNPVPRIVGKIRRKHAVEIEDLKFLRAHTKKAVKMTVPGPFTMSQQAQNEYYRSEEEASMDYAVAVNEEIRDLFAAGADIVQIDEPYMQARPEKARRYGLAALARALEGIAGTTAVHICFGYAAVIHARPSGYSFLGELAGIFEVIPAAGRKEQYLELAAQLRPELEKIDGFISVERFASLTDESKLLSLSFWRDEEAVRRWRNLARHREAQARGRSGVFADYRLRIASVVRDYGMTDRDEAPRDSRSAHPV